MHGQYAVSINREIISEEGKILWLLKKELKGENEGETKVGQEHALRT